ncbi:MAG: aminoacyl-tRNA hydrolase [Flavobacteriaceae bacterium]|nr:aminoacyl-tRNA hydrolase [Flavobacteriaceae bacterium]
MDTGLLIKELVLKAIRSSGPGGQHVNKVSSKIELSFDLSASEALSEEEKTLLLNSFKSRMTKDGRLILQCDESRNQHRNREIIVKRFLELVKTGLKKPKKRKKTRMPAKAKEKRLEAKRRQSTKKEDRKKPDVN